MITNGLGALKPITLSSLDEEVDSADNEERLLCPVRVLTYHIPAQYRSLEQERP